MIVGIISTTANSEKLFSAANFIKNPIFDIRLPATYMLNTQRYLVCNTRNHLLSSAL